MQIDKAKFVTILRRTGAPVVPDETIVEEIRRMAIWFFVRKQTRSKAAQLTREALLELDETDSIIFRQPPK